MNRLKYFALAALVAFAACDEGDEVVVPEPVTGSITGTVTVDGAGQAGVTVTLSSGASETTGSNGSFTFSGVEAGAYTVSISGTPSDAAFGTTSQAAVISSAGQVVSLSFEGSFITTSAISASISVPGVGALSGATISISGQSSASQTTGASGTVTFNGLRAGSYTVSVALSSGDAALYDLASASQAITLAVDELQAVAFTATPKTISTISGQLFIDEASKNNTFDVNSEDALEVANIAIIIEGVSVGVFDTIQTGADGSYSLTGLPAANYRVALQTGDAQIPGAVTFSADSDAAPVITLGVADSEVINFPFDITTQSVTVGAFLGADEDNGPAGVDSRVEPISGATIRIYPTTQDAQNLTNQLAAGSTTSSGLRTLSFPRANDTDPFGGPSDNVVFATVTGGIGGTLSQNGENIIEIPFNAKDSLVIGGDATDGDVFDYLNTDFVVAFKVQETDGDTYPGIGIALRNADDFTPGSLVEARASNTDGMAYFDIVGAAPGDEFFFHTRRAPWATFVPTAQLPYNVGGPYTFTETFTPDAGGVDGEFLAYEWNGTSFATDTIFVGTGNLSWNLVEVRGKVFREFNDELNYQAGDDNFAVVDVSDVSLEYDSAGTWVEVADEQPTAGVGDFIFGAETALGDFRVRANTQNAGFPNNWAILNDTTIALGIDGSDQRVDVCPLRDAGTTTFATCASFALKNQQNTISGTILYRDGSPAPNGTEVQISTDVANTVQGRASTGGDTIVTVFGGAGFFQTNPTVREGNYIITPVSDDDIFFNTATNGAAKSVEVEGFGVDAAVATATPARSVFAAGTAFPGNSPAAAFHGHFPSTTISGSIVNDRDEDGNTIDTDEALEGITVNLLNDDVGAFTSTTVIASTTTNAQGQWSFEDLVESAYRVTVDAAGFDIEVLGNGAADELDYITEATNPDLGDDSPDPLPYWDYENETIINGGVVDANVLVGTQFTFLFTNGTVNGNVTNAVGGADIVNITVSLTQCADATLPDPAVPTPGATCGTDGLVSFTQTDANGDYEFSDLREGIYVVSVVAGSAGDGDGPFTTVNPDPNVLVFVDGNGDLEVVNFTVDN